MTARGKCEAKRSTSPLVNQDHTRSRPERPKYTPAITPFQGCIRFIVSYQGRRASRLPLAFISRAVGAFISCRWRFHLVPLALSSRAVGAFISRRWRFHLAPLALSSRAVGAFISRRWRFHRAVGPFISCRWLCHLEEAVVALDGPLKQHILNSCARADVVNDQIMIS